MSGAFWAHSEAPDSIAGAVLGCRSFLASGKQLYRNGEDSIHALRLLLIDGLQTYGRYEGSLRPLTGAQAATIHLDLQAPRDERSREILIDALSLHASVMRTRGIPLQPPASFAPTDAATTLAVETQKFQPVGLYKGPTAALQWNQQAASGGGLNLPQESRGYDAGLLPAIALAGPAAAWTVIAVTGIVSTLVAYMVSKATDSVDNWQRTRAAVDTNLTRQATSYAKLMQVHQQHAEAEERAKARLPYSPAEEAIIGSARGDLEQGRRDASGMVAELAKPPAASTSNTILILGLAAVAGLAYTQSRTARA